MKANEPFETLLTRESIDEVSTRVRQFLGEEKFKTREISRYALTLEELLLKMLDEGMENAPLSLNLGKRFFRSYISVSVGGKSVNVFAPAKSGQSLLGAGILRNLGLSPDYSYDGEKNNYSFRVRKENTNPFLALIAAVVIAVIVGFGGYLFPDNVRLTLLDSILTPLHDVFLDALGCIAGPMIFLSVAWGIYGIGDAATLKRVGKRMLIGYIGVVYLAVLLIGSLCTLFVNLNMTGTVGDLSEFGTVFSILLGVVPENIVSPFVNGNTLQIIFLAIVIGIAMLFLEQKTSAVAKAVEQINYIVQFLTGFISRLVPYFIGIVLVDMIWSDTAGILLDVIKLFLMIIGSSLLLAILLIGVTSIICRVNYFTILKKGIPTFLVAFTTASSAAAFGMNIKACREKFGIDEKIMSFGIPLGMVTFKPTTALSYLAVALFFSEQYGLEVSVSWIIVMMFCVGILAVATPPIPGGAMTAYTVLFLQLGIPAEALAVTLAADAIIDFVVTGFDQFLIPYVLLGQAKKLGMVDREILTRK